MNVYAYMYANKRDNRYIRNNSLSWIFRELRDFYPSWGHNGSASTSRFRLLVEIVENYGSRAHAWNLSESGYIFQSDELYRLCD